MDILIGVMQSLRELREQANLKQMDLAAQVGTTPAKVSSWELGRSLPPTRFLAALARTLGVSADDLLEAISESRAVAPPPGEDRRRRRATEPSSPEPPIRPGQHSVESG